MKFKEYKDKILEELSSTLDAVSNQEVEELRDAILASNRIFIGGAGRSGFMMRCFAMRLMHLGLQAYFLGETITPKACKEDLLIMGSGSGKTSSLVASANKAKDIGSKIGLITISKNCTLGEIADHIIEIPVPSSKVRTDFTSFQPMGNLFEQALLFTCEIIVIQLMEKTAMTSEKMFKNHANIE